MRKNSFWKRKLISATLAVTMVASTFATAFAADSVLPDDHRGLKSAQPDLKGYRIQEILNWDPATDPYSDYLVAHVPLQKRNELFQATQANPTLNDNAKIMLMQGDYGNAFFESPLYNNDFSNLCMNFWQYTDFFCPWHGAVPYDTPESFYDSPKDSWWTRRGFEFGIVNLPTAAYTNAAHKNGALSIACIYFDPTGRPGQTCSDMFEKDAENGFPVAKKMVEMARYYGFDGYFFNNEENTDQSFKDFMKVIRDAGLYVQYYNTANSFGSKQDWLGTPANRYCDSVFVNYGWPWDVDSDKAEFAKGVWDPYEAAFYGVESNQGHLNGEHGSESGITKLYKDAETDHNPIASVALFTPSDFYHRGLTDNLDWQGAWDGSSPNQNPDYQWMIAERERMYFSGPNIDPTNTGKTSVSRPDIALPKAGGWVGVADFIAERSVIGGSNFYSNFNTGHGMQYFKDGAVSTDEEWSNMNLQDILPTWQWWIDTTGEKKLSADFDYGVKETRKDSSFNPMKTPYTQVGAYDGGSSLVVYGELDGKNTVHIFKTDLAVSAGSSLEVTYQKVKGSTPAKIGLVMKDAPDTVIELDLANSANVGGWVTDSISLADYAGKNIAAIYLIADGTEKEFQMNLGSIRVKDGENHTPEAPAGLTIKNIFADGQMELRWDKASYDQVKQYNIYVTDSEGNKSFAGGIYGDSFYVKNVPTTGEITVELTAVGADGTESAPASVAYNFDNKVSNVSVPQARQVNPNNQKSAQTANAEGGVVDAHWTAPATADFDHYELTVSLINYGKNYEGNKVYTATAPADATSCKVPVPVTERYDYLLEIRTVNADGTKGDPICFQGKLKDSYAEPLTIDDVYLSNDTVYLKTPKLMDWYRVHLTIDGKEQDYRQRATNSARSGWQVQNKQLLSFTMEDYLGNVSEPLELLVNNGTLEVPNGILNEHDIPDPELLNAVKEQVGMTKDVVAEYEGPLDLSDLQISDLTGLELMPGLTSIKFNNNTVLKELNRASLSHMTKLNSIDITGCTALTKLDISNLGLEHFIADGEYTNLRFANISGNRFDLSEGTIERASLDTLMKFTGTEAPVPSGEPEFALTGATLIKAEGFMNNSNAGLIFDGDVKTREDCGSYSTAHAFVEFKLPQAETITIWEPYCGHNNAGKAFGAKSGILYYSNDEGQTWTEIDRVTDMVPEVQDATKETAVAVRRELSEPVTAQYFKYEITDWCPNDWRAAWDVMLYKGGMSSGGILFDGQHPAAYAPAVLLNGKVVNLPKTEGTKDLHDYAEPLVSLYNNVYTDLGNVRINGIAFTADDYAEQLPKTEWEITACGEGVEYGSSIDVSVDRTYNVTFTDKAAQEPTSTFTIIVGEGSKIPENLLLDPDNTKGYILGATHQGGESYLEETFRINDGDYKTAWCPGYLEDFSGAYNEAWIAVDLKEEKTITEWKQVNTGVLGYPPENNTVNYDLEVLDTSKISVEDLLALEGEELKTKLADDSIWKVVASHRENTENETVDKFQPPIHGRIFRLNVLKGSNSQWYPAVRVVELELYGYIYTKPVDPEPTEPTPTEPTPTEPEPTEPEPTEPAPTEPAPTEPAPTEPAPTEPAPTEPTPTEPEPTEPAPIEPLTPFVDVEAGYWAEKEISEVVERGLFVGTSETTFAPKSPMTRGMFVTVLGRLAGVNVEDFTGTSFDDVDTGRYYAPYVAWAAENGITNGTSETTFAPNKMVSRQEMAVFLYRYCEYAGITLKKTTEVDFVDADEISNFAKEAVQVISEAGLLKGVEGNRFAPLNNSQRAQVAALMVRFIDATEK